MAIPRTRIEQVAEIRPPLGRVLWHYAFELAQKVPHSKWMLKWIAIGTAFVVANTLIAIWRIPANANKEAIRIFEEKQAEIAADKKRKKADEDGKQENREITERAIANWKQWEQSFVGPGLGVACYHGHDFKAVPKFYHVTCSMGPKGQPPNLTIVCDQHSCGTPKPPPEKKK